MAYEDENIKEKIMNHLIFTLNDILKIEENNPMGRPDDLSLKEIHVIEAAARGGGPARASDVAAALRVSPGTLTSAVDLLEKKGYLTRSRDINDKRGVRISLTEAGEAAREKRLAFRSELAAEIISVVGSEDARSINRSFEAARAFYLKKESALNKNGVIILADSTCDLGAEDAARLGVKILPMNTTFGDAVYRQDIDLSATDFYRLLEESKTQPVTSQLTPFYLENAYREALADGGEAVAIHLSSALSGTYQSAVLASREVPGTYAVDSKSASMGSALLVRIAAGLREKGAGAGEIASRLAALSERVVVLAYIPTLKYLVRGGRLSATAGFVGSVLNIYPIISVRDGAVKSVGKARGKNAACAEIARMAGADGIDAEYGLVFAHAAAPGETGRLMDSLAGLTAGCEINECEIGAVIGAHSGPGAVGVAYIKK